jgi:hypothetical protein
MANLTAASRNKLKSSQFALPGKGEGKGGKGSGSYPIPDEEHARAALSLAHNAGPAGEAKIRAKVAAKFPGISVSGAKHKPTHGSGKLTAMGSKTLGALQDKHGADEGKKRFHAAMDSGKLDKGRMMTAAQDEAEDKKAGIKEGSAKDKALDKKRGVKD